MAEGTYERKISKKRFFLAFVLTSFIFIIGMLVGFTLTEGRTGYLEDIAYKQKLDYESLQLQSLYLDISASNASCSVFNNILETSLNDVGSAQAKVDLYMKESSKESYTTIKRDYILAQMRYWLLNKKTAEYCKKEHVSLLYFYSNDKCVECGAQGTILSYLKEKLKDKLLVFSLDVDFKNEPMIGLLRKTYNITKVPSIVIEEKVFGGLIDKENLVDSICAEYKIKPDFCD